MTGVVSTDPGQPPSRKRLQSLDLLRGLTVLGMIIVNSSAALEAAGESIFPVLLHAKWVGFTAADAVFPAFVTMVGISIAASSKVGSPLPANKIFWRTVRLILLGLFLGNMYLPLAPDVLWPPRLPGVLQRIAVVYAISVFVYPRSSMRTRAIAAALLLLLYWGLCLMPLPDGTATDLYAQGRNIPSWFDRRLFGDWMGVKGPDGYDPEGFLSTIPVVAQCLIGTIAGQFLMERSSDPRLAGKLVAGGLACFLVALAWSTLFPIAKPIWTSSFVLLTAGLTIVGLALFHSLFDHRATPGTKGGLLGSFGRNAIGAYALHLLLIQLVMTAPFRAPIGVLVPFVGPKVAALAPVLLFVMVIWLPVAILDRRGKYLKI